MPLGKRPLRLIAATVCAYQSPALLPTSSNDSLRPCPPSRFFSHPIIISRSASLRYKVVARSLTLYLALCPLCAAKYKVLVKRDEGYLKEFIWAIEVTEEQVISVGMAGSSCTVRFVESHLLDVKTALSECLS